MAIAGSSKVAKLNAKNLNKRSKDRKRALSRRVLLENLEVRHLLAVGPQLISIQPNEGGLLTDGATYNISPREFIFRFDDSTSIDSSTLGGIRLLRTGGDGVFDRAYVSTDLGTNAEVVLDFAAVTPGSAGNGIDIRFTKASYGGTSLPRINVSGRTIHVELNVNFSLKTRASDLIRAMQNNAAASALVTVNRLRGSEFAFITDGISSGHTLTLTGAGSARASTNFNAGSQLQVEFLAEPAASNVQLVFTSRDRGQSVAPGVTVSNSTVRVELNSNPRTPSSVQEVINAINGDANASAIVRARLVSGSAATRVGGLAINYSPIQLIGDSDIVVTPAFVGVGDSPREVIMRFAEPLPDDLYRIDILGSGPLALRNINGDRFNGGVDSTIQFKLDLGARIESVIPQPIVRNANGTLTQLRNEIHVYFNDDDLDQASATNPRFYQLRYTRGTLTGNDDLIFYPSRVDYSAATDRAVLTFNRNLDELVDPATGNLLPLNVLRLRIGTDEERFDPPTVFTPAVDPSSEFANALNINPQFSPTADRPKSIIINSEIVNTTPYSIDFPGGNFEPGNRNNRYQQHVTRVDANGIDVIEYNFQSELGRAGGSVQLNAITETQKQLARQVLTLYSNYLGVRFVETESRGMTIAVGDMQAVVDGDANAPGGLLLAAGPLRSNGQPAVVIDIQDFNSATENVFGSTLFRSFMQGIGLVLGLGRAEELPNLTVQSSQPVANPGIDTEMVFPGNHDIVHGQHVLRPEGKDIDLYRFSLPERGELRIETFAERLADASLLDTHLRLYQRQPDGSYVEIAANGDYYSQDSMIRLNVRAGNYIVAVSAKGNETYDPRVVDSGLGGKSEGRYQLRIDFRPPETSFMVDSSATGKGGAVRIDGDGDGRPGGIFNFWFMPTGPRNTVYVDKAAPNAAGDGSLGAPFRRIQQALSATRSGTVVRIVGNGGADGRLDTTSDNLAYEIGFNRLGQALADGTTFDVPKDVTVMIDAGAILKLYRSRISVGSTSVSVDRSGSSLQVLGIPRIIDGSGRVIADLQGNPVPGHVYFTSLHDRIGRGANSDTNPPNPRAGDWGGIDFRNLIDGSDDTRTDRERQGLFLNSIVHGAFRYGGGQVVVDGVSQIVNPIQMLDSRPTIVGNVITNSADAAMSATPNSFKETNFHDPVSQSAGTFVADFERVGPAIHGNRLTNNSINGLFVKVRTAPGAPFETMSVAGRFDDSSIVHVISENLVIAGNPGGAVMETNVPPSVTVVLSRRAGGELPAGTYNYKLVYVDAQGSETPASEATMSLTVPGASSIVLNGLPPIRSGLPFVARRIYRSDATGGGNYRFVAQINANSTSFTDQGNVTGGVLNEAGSRMLARLHGSLTVDPGMVLKFRGSRIDVELGASLIAEGQDGGYIVMTSINDVRYGAGGTFDTANANGRRTATAGDWGGIYVGHTSSASLDYVRVQYGGGVTRTDELVSFNAIEAHQAALRVANSRIEHSANGFASDFSTRGGRGTNFPGTIFVRGSQPILVNNRIVSNAGPAINIDVNSLDWTIRTDTGRVSGPIDRVSSSVANHGPLVSGNQLDRNGINGMVVRGQLLTTQSVWDDTDIVHVVFDEIVSSNFHTYGGLRMQSAPNASLVVKFSGIGGGVAGLTATGLPLDIPDRIGGSIQIVGQPGFPVVLTSLTDDSVGAGFTPDGRPQVDTDGRDSNTSIELKLPTGPEVDNGTLIDNDVAPGIPGQFAFRAGAGGRSGFVVQDGQGGGISAQGNTQLFVNTDAIFEFFNFIDVGADGQAFELGTTTITQPPTLVDDDLVVSQGTFAGNNGNQVRWRVESRLEDGIAKVFNRLTLESDQPLGNMLFINYLDEDVLGSSDDLLYLVGTPGLDNFRAFTLDGPERIGFAHGGVYFPGSDLVNASYEGWAADSYANLINNIRNAGTQYTVPGNINTTNLPLFNDPALGPVYGLRDITTAFAWRVDPSATTATMMSFLELVPADPGTAARSGDWRGIELQTLSNDRNVATVVESESGLDTAVGANDIPNRSQYLGHLSDRTLGGDENVRLGYEIHGAINKPSDVDVYSFTAFGGTEVWLDIDRTSYGLDTVVELIDANGNILALSDNSFDEEADPSLLFRSNRLADTAVHPLRKSTLTLFPKNASGSARDLYSTNPSDAGMRVVLPGQPNSRTLYHVRVRSSNLMPGDPRTKLTDSREIRSGQSTGAYQLQIRLREEDEIPGSGVSYADIRFAQNGVVLSGLPRHSPFVGETSEQEARDLNRNGTLDPGEPPNNNIFPNAQELGNLLQTDRQAISLSGRIESPTDVDWFTFTIDYQLLLTPLVEYFSTVFDMDYADGVGRPDTSLYLFDDSGRLIYSNLRSNLVDDRARPGRGADNADLSRGTAGTLDPFLGPVELRQGRYFLAISNARMVPRILVDPLVRLQPTSSTRLIVEDHVERVGGSTAVAPIVPQFIHPASGSVPYTLGDMALYVSQGIAPGTTDVRMINPMTGQITNTVGSFNSVVRDIAFRFNGSLQGFATPLGVQAAGDPDTFSDYLTINSGTGVITVAGNLGIETFHPDPADPTQATDSDVGINVEAITFADLGTEVGFAVGNRGPGPGAGGYNTNILYQFNPATGAATSSPLRNRIAQNNGPDERIFGAGTDVVERGQINTSASPGDVSRRLVVTEATRTFGLGSSTHLILDGTRFSLRDSANFNYIFEFDAGPQLRLNYHPSQGRFMRDGDRFSIDGDTFEFDTGGVIVVNSLDGSTVVDGTIVTITDNTAGAVVRRFEFDRNNSLTNPNHIRVPYTNGTTQAGLIQSLVNAINTAGFGARAVALTGSNRITVTGKSSTANMTSTSSSVSIEGAVGLTNVLPVARRIPIDETMTTAEFVSAIRSAMNPNVQVGFDGDRLNFAGAQTGVFTSFSSRNVGTDLNSQGGTSLPGAIPILFLAQDTEETIAARAASAINAQGIPGTTATAIGRNVNITLSRFETASDPFKLGDVSPGGIITGIAVIANSLYAVSNLGGLYRVDNPAATQGFQGGRIGSYVRTSSDLLGIRFTGLTAGPRNLENGRYSNILFGTDVTGRIYAFDTSGRLAPVFANGETSVATGISGINGLSFSTLDFNLWHITQNRAGDVGHGMLPTPDNSNSGSPGGSSWYFGFESPTAHPNATFTTAQDPTIRNTYNFPGGAQGVLESRPFSLSGIAAADLPTLYFNYFVATENVNSSAVDGANYMRDSFRAYIMSAQGRWEMLATNNSDRASGIADDEFDPAITGTNATVELFDNTATWRQAKIDLSQYAGQDNLKLRFEFSTAGGLGYGQFGGRGPEIRLVAGSHLRDGQKLTIGGRVFEIEMGSTLIVPPGSQLTNGTFVDVEGVRFVLFDGNGPPPATGTVVSFAPNESAEVIAQRLLAAINAAQYPKTTISNLNFSSEAVNHNDVIGLAFRSPIDGERFTISGQGIIGDNPLLSGTPDRDIDMISMRLKRGMRLTATTNTSLTPLDPLLRLFDSSGRELASNDDFGSKDSQLVFTVPADGEYYLGVSASGNAVYNAVVFGTANLGGTQGSYQLTIDVDAPVVGVLAGNLIQLLGVDNLRIAENSPFFIMGEPGSDGIPVYVRLDDDANAVGRALRNAVAASFAGGTVGSYQLREEFLRLDGLTVQNAGPFTVTQNRNEDLFSEFAEVPAITRPAFRAQNNNFEGVYLDDFFIGVADRGEIVMGGTQIDTVFVDLGPTGAIEVGPYQLEFRGASDFGTPLRPRLQPTDVELILTEALEPNGRLVEGQSIRFRNGAQIGDGQSFTISDGIATMTFEFEDDVRRNGVSPGSVPVLFNPITNDPVTGITRVTTANEIAAIVRNLINSNTVQSVLNISANMINGDDRGTSSDTLAIFGNPTITIPASIGDLIVHRGFGDKNREREQGQVIIENSRFSNSAGFGLVLAADPRDDVSDAPNPGSIRATVVLNNERLVPGAVIRNNEFMFNASGGMDIRGEAATAFRVPAPIPMARIYNNTIVGGTITLPSVPDAQVFGGVLFPQGTLSFADTLVNYNPNIVGGPVPIAGLQNATNAIGAPNYTGSGEPLAGQGVVSLGRGGQLVVQFTNNYLRASGDSRPDLYVFEVGDFESVRVEVSSDNVTYRSVGQTTATGLIDLDAFGIEPHERFFFVRLTDIATQGATTGDSVGADIDAVGAITSAVNELYTSNGVGIQISDNVNPTLLNNIFVNNATAIQVAADSSGTIVGGSLFHRNARDLNGNVASNQFALSVGAATQLFVDPVGRILYPFQESPAIDSSINSLDDRPSLVALRNALGMRTSPILAPNNDINGMLRVDDPAVEPPSGLGENVFKDRGAAERGDFIGPSAFILNPLDNDSAGKDINPITGTVELVGEASRHFDIQLIDGAEQGLLSRGSGINDSTVTSSSVVVFRNSDVLVEGVDYRFGYDSTNKVIRLTPLAGVWRSDAAYRIRLLGTQAHTIRLNAPNGYLDDELIDIFDADGKRFTFGFDLGYRVQVPVTTGEVHDLRDGETFTIDDGRRRFTFEIDLNGRVSLGTILVALSDTNTPAEAAAKIVEAIRGTNLNVVVTLSANGLFQILGDRSVILTAGGTGLSVTGSAGVDSGYGLRIPSVAGVAEGITDGQRFTITTGSGLSATIELDTNGRVSNGNVAAFISNATSINSVATAIVSAIRQAGLGLAPKHAGNGIILIGGDEETRISLGNTVLSVIGSPGSPEAIPIAVQLESPTGASGIAQSLATAIRAANMRGVTVLPMGSKLLIEGARGVVGPGVEIIRGIQDNAGNALLDNQAPKGTELYIFLGNGLDYGDAPDPIYQTKLTSNGPRHKVVAGFGLGPAVTTDPDARATDSDDGVKFTQDLTIGFNTSITVTAKGITASRKGYLSAWVDFNGDGRFESTEVLVLGREMVEGENAISFRVPAGSKVGSTWARFRYSSNPILVPVGFAADGEVEDYQVTLKQNPYQNRSNAFDVNGDGRVSAIDVLQVINYMIINGTGPLPFPPNVVPPFVDVDGDGSVFPRDALAIINFLNQRSSGGGEGESSWDVFENATAVVGVHGGVLQAPAARSIQQVSEDDIDAIDLGSINSSVVYGPLPLSLMPWVRSFDFEESSDEAIFIDCSEPTKQKTTHDLALEEVFSDFE